MTHSVLQCEELRKNAMNTGDVESFRELFDPAMIYRHSSGVVDNVTSYLEKLYQNYAKITKIRKKIHLIIRSYLK